MFIESEYFSDRRQCMRSDSKVSVSVNMVSRVTQSSVLEPLQLILYTSDLFHTVGNHIVDYVDDTTIYAIIARPLSHPKVMELPESGFSSNQFLVLEVTHESQTST